MSMKYLCTTKHKILVLKGGRAVLEGSSVTYSRLCIYARSDWAMRFLIGSLDLGMMFDSTATLLSGLHTSIMVCMCPLLHKSE